MTIRRTVKRILDGDTIQTYRKVNGSNYIRLAGVNAPERYQFGGRAATQRLKNRFKERQLHYSQLVDLTIELLQE